MISTLYSWRTAVATIAAGFAILWSVSTAQAQGNWTHPLGNNQDTQTTAMSVAPNGEVVIAGLFHGTVDFDPGSGEKLLSAGPHDTSFLAKYDPAGNFIWAYKFEGTDDVRINDIVVDGVYYIGVAGSFQGEADLDPGSGSFYRISEGGDDIFLLRLLPDGNMQWGWTTGDSDHDAAFTVATDAGYGLYVAGTFQNEVMFQLNSPPYPMESNGGRDIFIARFTNGGGLAWIRTIGGDEDDMPTDITLDGGERVYIAGEFRDEVDLDPTHTSLEVTSRGRSDIFVTILGRSFGNWLSSIRIGGEGADDNARVLAEADGSFYISGEFERTTDLANGGSGGSVTSRGGEDVFLTRYGANSAFQWGFGVGGAGTETNAALARDRNGDVYLLGAFAQRVDFNPGADVRELSSSGDDDIFVAQYTAQGQYRQVRGLVNPQRDVARAIAIDNHNDVIIAGEFRGTLDLGSDLSVSTGQPENIYNVFLTHYSSDAWSPFRLRAYLPNISPGIPVN
jgi:hypothetical protein